MTTILTLYSGPGSGKSTSSSLVYGWLKSHQFSAELAREYAKKWAWQGRKISGLDELYLTGKQIHEESQYLGKVDYVVSDKPVLMDVYYARKYASATIARGVEGMVRAFYEEVASLGHRHVHVFLSRTKPYDPRGRYEDEATARSMDGEIRQMLGEFGLPYEVVGTDLPDVWGYCERLVGGDGSRNRLLGERLVAATPPTTPPAGR